VTGVGVVIVVPGQSEPWKVSNAAFQLLLEEAMPLIRFPQDTETLLRAQAMHGLFLDSVPVSEQTRLAILLGGVARQLRKRLLDGPAPDEWEASLIDKLPVLEMWMDGLAQEAREG
jgi:hypothetical protein